MLELTAGECVVAVDLAAGGRIAQIAVGDQHLLADSADPAHGQGSIEWGLFAMAPWVGRVGQGRFNFDGVDYQLGLNHRDGKGDDRHHAIHGTVFGKPWAVTQRDAASLDISCSLTDALDWPFDGVARQRIALSNGSVELELSVESDGRTFPAELGWHPWFPKPHQLSFEPTAMYQRDPAGLPTGAIVDPSKGPWDDCFLNKKPVTLHYDRSTAPAIRIESDCDHWVVFDLPAATTCVEPQSGPPNTFQFDPHIVAPGKPLRRTMSISW